MSGAAVFRHALALVREAELPTVAERDVVVALEAPRPGPLSLLYDLAHECGLERGVFLTRASACYFVFCGGNLADDLIDGDCDYLPVTVAPSVEFTLGHLACHAWARASVPSSVLAEVSKLLVQAGSAESLEVRTATWTEASYRAVAEGIAGRQWSAYLSGLWAEHDGDRSSRIGRALGIVLHVTEDVRTLDPRFHGLSPEDRSVVLAWAREELARLRDAGSATLDAVAGACATTLEAA